MDARNVPQDDNAALGGHRKAVYAKGPDGRIVAIESRGWEVEEIVNRQAVDALRELAEAARARVLAGTSSPLEYWMYARRMDPELLAQASGIWRWRVRRHLRPATFTRLSPRLQQRYADALGITVDQLCRLP
jgi:hypothetical protein